MERLKIVHVITRLDLGGAQQNTLYTASHLGPGFDCLLIAGEGGILDAQARSLEESGALRLKLLDSLVREPSPMRDLLALLELARIFAAERPQVVHTHSSKAGILARLAALAAGVPAIVHTYHGFGFHDFQPPGLRSLFLWLERLCGLFTDRLVFVARANQETALRHGLGKPQGHVLIRSGIKLSDFPARLSDRAAKKASLGLGRHKSLVTSVGNLKPQKNPADFVAMAQAVSAQSPETEFLFVGDGPLRERLEARILASGLNRRLTLAGWRRDAAEILAASDVFVLTSLWEGLPRALLEAMRSGVPPVCYATDGIRDVIADGENGFLVRAGDVPELSRRVLELLRDPALRLRLGEQAARTITEEFDIDLMVRAQERLYLGLL